MRTRSSIGLIGIAIWLAAPAAGAQQPAPQQPRFLVSTQWLAQHLRDPSVVVIHVGRDSASYKAGHIPGARLLLLSSILIQPPNLPNELPPVPDLVRAFEAAGVRNDRFVVLYGDLGGLAAARAFFTLDYLGLGDRAALLDGGLEVWRAEGRPVESAAPGALSEGSGSLEVRPRPEIVVDAEWIARRLGRRDLVLIDARPQAEYSGKEPGAGIARPGHIPGAVNFFWREALVSQERPLLLDRETLEARYRSLGVKEGVEIVTYCRTGMQASHTYFVLRYLGYSPRMYDGSYIDWNARAELPVETGFGATGTR
ncbi:MAG: sulfurtransferase [Gemmatimonadales bacterium]|nr:MAG: sulfurtransferase [Gemmatimonadales bacterium]